MKKITFFSTLFLVLILSATTTTAQSHECAIFEDLKALLPPSHHLWLGKVETPHFLATQTQADSCYVFIRLDENKKKEILLSFSFSNNRIKFFLEEDDEYGCVSYKSQMSDLALDFMTSNQTTQTQKTYESLDPFIWAKEFLQKK